MARRARLDERFWGKVNFFGINGCWDWAGYVTPQGYGSVYRGSGVRRPQQAHVVAYELLIGPKPEGFVLDHLCRNRKCVNPSHLEVVTQRENVLRGESQSAQQAKRTECPKGHPYDLVEVTDKKRTRRCRKCRNEKARLAYHSRKKSRSQSV